MILACPACQIRYQVEDEAVSRPSGRTVRCASCGHSWHYISPQAAPPTAPLLRMRERPQSAPTAEQAAEPRPAITAPSPPRRRHTGLGWVVLILLIGAIVVGAIIGRDQIVALLPQVAPYYELVGLKIQPLGAGLDIANINSTRNADGLIVEGDVSNKTGVPRNVPRLRVALRDGSQKELVFKVIEPPRERLLPGETSHFVVAFLPAPDGAVNVMVTFSAS